MPTFSRISSSPVAKKLDLAISSSIVDENRPNSNVPRKHRRESRSDGSTAVLGPRSEWKTREARRVTRSPQPLIDISPASATSSDVATKQLNTPRRQTIPDQPLSSEPSREQNIKPNGGSGQKRKADSRQGSDIKNKGGDKDDQTSLIGKEDSSLLPGEPGAASGADGEEESEAAAFVPSAQNRKVVYDLLSPSEEETSDFEHFDASVARRSSSQPSLKVARVNACHVRSKTDQRQGGWITSFHVEDCEESSSDEDQDVGIRFLEARDWMTSQSRDEKLEHLQTIIPDEDKALQLLAWDEGFGYNFHEHQFKAVRFVAGLVKSFPRKMKEQADADESSVSSVDSMGESEAIQEMLRIDERGRCARSYALRQKPELTLPGRGMILADEMGLGKTIEALAGAVLRNAMRGHKAKPTLIVTPQDGVQQQWVDSLSKAGVEPARIRVLGEKRSEAKKRGWNEHRGARKAVNAGEFIICTRYKIQSMIKGMFDYSANQNTQANNRNKSFLFRKVPLWLIRQLRHQYNVDKGKETGGFRRKEAKEDRLTKLVRNSLKGKNGLATIFETVVIDEAHFLRNVLAYWGIGAALLGAQAKRTVLLTGTPYNNSHRDMSALMTFIDPEHKSASVKWWEKATRRTNRNDVIEAVRDWRETFMLRRTKDILRGKNKLPPLRKRFINVPVRPSELGIYEAYEATFLKVLNLLQEEIDDGNRQAQRELVNIMMACMSCMRMALIHPILPGGREVTIQFSPSRKNLLKQEEQKDKCIFCSESYPSQKARAFAEKINTELKEESDAFFPQLLGLDATVRSDDNIMDDDNERSVFKNNDATTEEEKGPMIELGPDICRAHGSDCCHFAHQRCLEIFAEDGGHECPRCLDLASRTHCTSAGSKKIYCQEVGTTVNSSMGFTASTKIERAIEWFQTSIPKGDKCIFLSFFKGSLDLLEGILVEDLGIECARYDGDVAPKRRQGDLKRFQKNKNCRVLLASVQSGGTGLNICEANHICFVDRWFNPQIHDQAQSRCHRLGQEKEVKVAYLDTCFTVDMVMKQVNVLKEGNADVLLADGFSLGNYSVLNYNDTPGVVGGLLKPLPPQRHTLMMKNAAAGRPDAPLYCKTDLDIESKLHDISAVRTARKAAVKTEDTSDVSSNDGSSSHTFHSCTNNDCYSIPSSDDDSDDNFLYATKSRGKAHEPSLSTKKSSLDSKSEKAESFAKSGVSVLSSGDDSLNDVMNIQPTFCSRPHSKTLKPSLSNKKNVNVHGEEKNGWSKKSAPKIASSSDVIELSSDGEDDDKENLNGGQR